jgi:hypothetical protein
VFERFTERARQVVVLAQEEARGLRHSYIGTEHILLGLLREGEGLAARVLENLDVTVELVRGQVVQIVSPGEEVTSGQIPFTPRAKKVLELSLREALSLGHNYIDTEHVLLALVRENEGVAARILLDFGAVPETIRREVLRFVSSPSGPLPVGQAVGRRAPHPLRPPLDWERAGVLWRPDRVLRGTVREFERFASRILEEQLGVRVSRVRPRPMLRASVRGPSGAGPPSRAHTVMIHPPAAPQLTPGLVWQNATLLWRPEGLELRVPLRLNEGAMAAFASDAVWQTAPLSALRRELWNGWLALASPSLLNDVDPDELRRSLDGVATRALDASNTEHGRVQDFLRRLRG